ncbi:hypothetical protein, partial [Clavibacter michiganensis]|uniref:hypothetical protein n=1 Tax=Clavibacter michiganensis TaxID=28447 RepID=UPI0029307830
MPARRRAVRRRRGRSPAPPRPLPLRSPRGAARRPRPRLPRPRRPPPRPPPASARPRAGAGRPAAGFGPRAPAHAPLLHFDLDFHDRRRANVIRYVTDKYGGHRAAQPVTYGTLRAQHAPQHSSHLLGSPIAMPGHST